MGSGVDSVAASTARFRGGGSTGCLLLTREQGQRRGSPGRRRTRGTWAAWWPPDRLWTRCTKYVSLQIEKSYTYPHVVVQIMNYESMLILARNQSGSFPFRAAAPAARPPAAALPSPAPYDSLSRYRLPPPTSPLPRLLYRPCPPPVGLPIARATPSYLVSLSPLATAATCSPPPPPIPVFLPRSPFYPHFRPSLMTPAAAVQQCGSWSRR
jgi:hypothetical protein